jgi:hypothetical protein
LRTPWSSVIVWRPRLSKRGNHGMARDTASCGGSRGVTVLPRIYAGHGTEVYCPRSVPSGLRGLQVPGCCEPGAEVVAIN